MEKEKSNKYTDNLMKTGLPAIINAVKSSNELPTSGSNWAYYSSFPAFQTLMNAQASKILMMMQRCINHQQAKGSVLESVGYREVSDRFESLVEINDQLLERIQASLDEASGVKRPGVELCVSSEPARKFGRFTVPGSGTSDDKPSPGSAQTSSSSAKRTATSGERHVTRPQLRFEKPPDNSSEPFRPKLTEKPHARVPLHESLIVSVKDGEDAGSFPHPYQAELEALEFPQSLSDTKDSTKIAQELDRTPLTIVRTKSALKQLIAVLRDQQEIAVDLEHHAFRTYLGLTCLMQISTWEQDFIIDTLELWDHLERLNEVFADPSILKVFHGASSDVLWLQRDFGLYVVNMYDTGIGARYLGHARTGLGALLEHFCGVSTDKTFQLADWRQRPLSEDMITYARKDTHYLLEICYKQRAILVDQGRVEVLRSIWSESRDLCLSRFEKPQVTDSTYLDLYRSVRKQFNGQQLAALKSLVSWRDEVARAEDESHAYVLPNHMLVMICDTLPREHTGVFACCNPIPALVRKFIHDIHKLVIEARDRPLEAPVTVDAGALSSETNADDLVCSPHDLSHTESRAAPKPLPNAEECAMVAALLKSGKPALRLRPASGASGGCARRDDSKLQDPLRQYLLTTTDFALKALQKSPADDAATEGINGSPSQAEAVENKVEEEEDQPFHLERPSKKKVRFEKSFDDGTAGKPTEEEEKEDGEEEEGGPEEMSSNNGGSSFQPFDYKAAQLPQSSGIGRMRDRMLDENTKDSKKTKPNARKKKGQKPSKKKPQK